MVPMNLDAGMGEASQARHEMDAPISSCSLPRIVASAAEPSERTAYIKLHRQTACPPRTSVPVNQVLRTVLTSKT